MNMCRLLSFLIIFLASQAYAYNTVLVYGDARDIETSTTIYTEEHRISSAAHKVIYRQPDGSLIAKKNIQYSQGYATPIFQLYDERFGRTSGSKWEDGEWLIWQQQKSGNRQEKRIFPKKNLVIDAGFNHFVLDNFEALEKGNALDFTFAITDPPMELPMTIEKNDCNNPVFSQSDNNVLCLKVVTHNVFYRLFIPVIYLAYLQSPGDHMSHLLSLYQGPSNLTDNRDKAQNVRIHYRYEFTDEKNIP